MRLPIPAAALSNPSGSLQHWPHHDCRCLTVWRRSKPERQISASQNALGGSRRYPLITQKLEIRVILLTIYTLIYQNLSFYRVALETRGFNTKPGFLYFDGFQGSTCSNKVFTDSTADVSKPLLIKLRTPLTAEWSLAWFRYSGIWYTEWWSDKIIFEMTCFFFSHPWTDQVLLLYEMAVGALEIPIHDSV